MIVWCVSCGGHWSVYCVHCTVWWFCLWLVETLLNEFCTVYIMMVLFVTSKVPWSVSCVKILRYLLKIINPLTLGQIKLCMDPVNKNQKKKKSKFWFFNNYAKSYFCKNKIVSAKKLKIFDNAFMHLERSVMMSRFQNWKPNWKLSNIDRVIDKKFRWYSLKLYICSCNSVDF